MSIKSIVTTAVLLALLLVGAGAAYYAGLGPAPGGSDSDAQLTDYPTGTPLGTAAAGGSAATGAPTAPFSFTVESIQECGQTCRDVRVSLTNNQDQSASNVVVFTEIYAGQDNTAEEDLVWSGKEEVGTLEAGGTHTTTKRVELSLSEGLKIENHDGWVTVVTTVKTDEHTVTFKDVEQVA